MTGRTDPNPLVTVGHGQLSGEALVDVLRTAEVEAVVDVRRHPGSRRHPHLAREALSRTLTDAALGYEWVADLGGRRTQSPESVHVGLRDGSFRAYADHMGTPGFRAALGDLLSSAARRRTAIMCAESVWWRCHRRLIADAAVLLEGVTVVHLFHDGRLQPHPPTPEARVAGDHLVYDRGNDRGLPGL